MNVDRAEVRTYLAVMARDYVLQPFQPTPDLQIPYAQELNEQQLAAVTAPPGPALVIAGAGAGKTRTLIYRVAYLVEQGIPPERILLLTFTNKAAREMMRRVTELVGTDLQSLWGGTFHSVGHRVLRRHADRLGYCKDFTILDREDSKDLLKSCVGALELDPTQIRFPKADMLADLFSLVSNTSRPLQAVLEEDHPNLVELAPMIAKLAGAYAQRKAACNVMDFDDLQMLWLRLLQEHEDLREQYQRRFQFLLVDEYQDTNRIQGELIDLLAARHQNVTVVGDDSQSIYSWRGAHFQNILQFPKRYPEAKVYKIETNYRSTPEILDLANAAIAPNTLQFGKALAPVRRSGTKPILAACNDAHDQATFVAQRMLELREEGVDLKLMAVLYRSHFHSLELQLELTRRQIPFSIASGIRFFDQAHLKDLTAYLKLLCNPLDEVAFKRIVLLLPGVGARAADKLWNLFRGSLPASLPHPLATALQGCVKGVPKKAASAWTNLAITFSQLEDPSFRDDPSQLISLVLDAGYREHLKEAYTNSRNRLEDLEQLSVFAHQFHTTEDFLTQLALLSNLETEQQPNPSTDDERVRLSTVHQSKGLEFDVVFVIMLCDGLFPNARSLSRLDDEEEERRLFYVAITRARNELYLSYPLLRSAYGSGATFQQASRFLNELPRTLIEEWNLVR